MNVLRHHIFIKRLIFAVVLLTLFDAVCTSTGISIGAVTEANPIWSGLMQERPILASAAAFLLTCGLLAAVYMLRHRCRFVIPLLAVVTAAKAVIAGMHIYWISVL